MSINKDMKAIVTEHPKLLGVLFAVMFLLSQFGTVAAEPNHGFIIGP